MGSRGAGDGVRVVGKENEVEEEILGDGDDGQLTRPSGDGSSRVMEKMRSGAIKWVVVGGCDWNGVFRAKRVPAGRFASTSELAVEFSEYMWVMDLEDQPQPTPPGFEGHWPDYSNGFGDVEAVPDLATLREVPWLDRTALVLCDYRTTDGRDYEVAPRNVLGNVVARYRELGLEPRLAPEYEFVVFRETARSLHEKQYRDLVPLSDRPLAYGALQATIDEGVIGQLVESLGEMGLPVDTWAPEGAPGQYELNLTHRPALEAADLGFLFKQGVKELCAKQGMIATFIPKLDADYGSSLHVHQSLWSDGKPAFHQPDVEYGMAPVMRHYLAGQLESLTDFAAIWWPTPTAFKRAGVHSGAGTTESWGLDNKTVSLRVLAQDGNGCRIEHRVPGADANVYLSTAAMLVGGLYGIENQLEPPAPYKGDAYLDPGLNQLPSSLESAIAIFEQSEIANRYLGEELVRRFAATRRWELEQFRQAVTDWEMRRYMIHA